jgi:ketosteroid isomerase-like protein
VKLRTIAAFLALGFTPALVLAAPNVPPQPILKLANAVLHAADTGDASGLAGIYTSDAVVVDENAPFTWRGANAGAAWWSVVSNVTKRMKLTGLKAINIRISEFRQSASDAYLIEPMTIVGTLNGKPFAESGTMTYTFHNGAAKWMISSQVWTTKP